MGKLNYKKGAASFYVVAFSTLILLIIVASFTALVIAQMTRSSNADLSQSAYDSALAGVEDAKLAFYNYQSCLANGATAQALNGNGNLDCNEIVYLMEKTDSCDKVPIILGRQGQADIIDVESDAGSEVLIKESNDNGNNMSQAYTCVKIQTSLLDYRSTLSSSNQMKVVKVKLDGVPANKIKTVRISWGANLGQAQLMYSNFDKKDGGSVTFPPMFGLEYIPPANPPTLSVTLLQAGNSFALGDFDTRKGNQTNRGTVFLVPVDDAAYVSSRDSKKNYLGSYDTNRKMNYILKDDFLKSNDRTAKNLPYGVYCDRDNALASEFVCSAVLELPEPIGGERSDDNFLMAIALPYGQPATDFALEFFCAESESCGNMIAGDGQANQASLSGMQIGIDSTGRANDLFRRVETRLEGNDDFSLSMMGPLELFGDDSNNTGSSKVLEKNYSVICEGNDRFWDARFGNNPCSN